MIPRNAILAAAIASVALGGCVRTRTVTVANPSTPGISAPVSPGGAVASAPTVQGTCPTGKLGPAFNREVTASSLDPDLLDAAVLHYTNKRRCAQGLTPLAADTQLSVVARTHSDDMATHGFMGHVSPVPERAQLQDRYRGAAIPHTAGAENVARRSRLMVASGEPYFTVDRTRCHFSSVPNGPPIGMHTYRSLGEDLVEIWEGSPEHRVNLFSPRYTRLGSGIAIRDSETCGELFATQNFAA